MQDEGRINVGGIILDWIIGIVPWFDGSGWLEATVLLTCVTLVGIASFVMLWIESVPSLGD